MTDRVGKRTQIQGKRKNQKYICSWFKDPRMLHTNKLDIRYEIMENVKLKSWFS